MRSADEIAALAVTLNSMLERLAGPRERQRAFVADVAHELRSPLASIRAQLEVAQHLGEAGPLMEGLHVETLRMGALVEDLLTLARLDADAPTAPVAVPVRLDEAVATAVERYAGGRVAVSAGPVASDPPPAAAEPAEVDRILANLVENALRHARSAVVITASHAPGTTAGRSG